MLGSFWYTITAPIQDWLAVHPLWNWLFAHPLWLLGFGLFIIFLLSGLLRAIGRLTEWLWLAILRLPMRLTQWIFKGVSLLVISLFGLKRPAPPPQIASTDRLIDIVNRLEALKQEQDELLQEVKSILAVRQTVN